MKKQLFKTKSRMIEFAFATKKMLVALVLIGVVISNGYSQLKLWSNPTYQISFNTAPPTVSNLPGNISAAPINLTNSMNDVNGDLLFFITDLHGSTGDITTIYDKNGYIIDELRDDASPNNINNLLEFGQEISIVPMPGSCSKYYLITSERQSQYSVSVDYQYLPVYAILDMSLPNIFDATKKGALIYTPGHPYAIGSGTNLYNDLVSEEHTLTGNNDDYTTAGTLHYSYISGISVVQKDNTGNGSFYLFVYNTGATPIVGGTGVQTTNFVFRYVIDGQGSHQGIHYDFNQPDAGKLAWVGLGSNSTYAEMETIKLPDGNANGYVYRMACVSSYGTNSTNTASSQNNYISIINLDANGNYINSQDINTGSDNHVKGLEFSASGDYLYYTFAGSNTADMGYLNCTLNTYTANDLLSNNYPSNGLSNSFIELGYDGRMYFNDGNQLDCLTNPDGGPANANWHYMPTDVSFIVPIPQTPSTTLLPDQIDGYDYLGHLYNGSVVCCLGNTKVTVGSYTAGTAALPYSDMNANFLASNQTWTPYSNPFGGNQFTPLGQDAAHPVIISEMLMIPPGITVTIHDMYFKFMPRITTNTSTQWGGKVWVQNNGNTNNTANGGVLNLYNSTFTSYDDCGNGMWEGVEVMGDPWGVMPQDSYKQGRMYVNGSTISNAYYGVLLGVKYGLTMIPQTNPSYSGGVIKTQGAKFLDNQYDVYFSPYNVASAGTANNESNFKWTRFQTDKQLLSIGTLAGSVIPFAHVKLNDVTGIYFRRCTFENTPAAAVFYPQTSTGPTPRFVGISSSYSSFSCLPPTYGTTNGCSFYNLKYGVYATFASGSKTATVDYATFDNNARGVYFSGATLPTVMRSNFKLLPILTTPGVTTLFKGYGLYLNQCDKYKVEANDFTTNSYATPNNNIGIVVNAPPSVTADTRIYNNSFHDVWAGIQTQGYNFYNDPNPLLTVNNSIGLKIICNKFYNDTKEMDIGITSGGISHYQGQVGYPAGNQFTTHTPHNTYNNYYSWATTSTTDALGWIDYKYEGVDGIHTSDCQTFQNCYPSTHSASTPPNWTFVGGGVNFCGATYQGFHLTQSIPDLKSMLSRIESKMDSVSLLIRSGDETSLYAVLTDTLLTGDNIKDSLLAKSPYLSDKVLIAAIKSNPLSGDAVKDIVIANSPVTKAVKDSLNTINLTAVQHALIDSAQRGTSARYIAEDALRYNQYEYEMAKTDLLRANVNNDNAIAITDTVIKNVTSFRDDGTQARLLASLYSDKGDYVRADSIIDMMDTTAGEQNMAKILSVYKQLKQTGQSWESIISDAALLEKINDVAADSTLDGYQFAIGILQQVFGRVYFEPIDDVTPPMEDRSLIQSAQMVTTKKENGSITCYPNPASQSINFNYTLPNNTDQGTIKVYNVYGQLVESFAVNKTEGIEVFNLSKQADGLFFYSLFADNTVLDKGKFVIINK